MWVVWMLKIWIIIVIIEYFNGYKCCSLCCNCYNLKKACSRHSAGQTRPSTRPCIYIYISHTYIAWHCTFIYIHISYIHSMLQHTYLIRTLNMQDECTNKEWSWAFPNPILTLRILQFGPSPRKAFIPWASLSIMGLASKLSRLNGPPNFQGWMGLQLNSSILIHNSCDLHLILGIPKQIIYILKLCN